MARLKHCPIKKLLHHHNYNISSAQLDDLELNRPIDNLELDKYIYAYLMKATQFFF